MDWLPNELIEAILRLLEPADLWACSMVSWPWRHTSRRLLGFERPDPVDCLGDAVDGIPKMETLLSRAAYRNRADIINCARARGYPWDDEVCPAAAYGGHTALLASLRGDTHCPCPLDDCLVAAAAGGHLGLVVSLVADIKNGRFRPTESSNRRLLWWKRLPVRNLSDACARALVAAVSAGHLDVVSALKRHVSYYTAHDVRDSLTHHIVKSRTVTLPEYLDDTASLVAAERGDRVFLSQFWYRLDQGHRRAAPFVAALHGHVGLVRWIQNIDAGRSIDDIETLLIELILLLDRNSSGDHDSISTIDSALSTVPPSWSRDLAVAAAYAGHVGVLVWLKAQGVLIRRVCTLAAAYNGHTHVLKWARDHGVRFSGLSTSVAAARGHQECAQFCESQCAVPLLWEYNEPLWRRSHSPPFGHFEFGRRKHVAEMASSYGCAASAARLAQRCPKAPTPQVFKRIWLAGDRRVILPLVGQVRGLYDDLMEAAAAKCQIDTLCALGMDKDGLYHWNAQRMFLACTRSSYGWRNVFTWLADRGYRCDDSNMYNMLNYRYSGPYADEAFRWAIDQWCPWPRGDRVFMYPIRPGSPAAECVLMSDEDPLVVRHRACEATATRSPLRK
jgi:hypothetical protein